MDIWHDLQEHRDLIFLICFGFCRNQADAEDQVQETYIKAWRKIDFLHTLNGPDHLKMWICRVARNSCLDHLRRVRVRSWLPFSETREADEAADPERIMIKSEQTRLLGRAIATLTKRTRDVLILREYAALSYGEIATLLSMKEGTVMSTLNRARSRVQSRVKELMNEKQRT